MATFPGGVSSFPTLVDLVDSVLAAHQNEPNDEIEAIQTYILNSLMMQGQIQNGYIDRTISSNNLVNTLKTASGGTPSATDPVRIKIGATVRSITSSLAHTVTNGAQGGTGHFNAGAVEHANQDIDLFVYAGWRASTSTVFLVVSRIPFAKTYGDFGATPAQDHYGIATGTTPASTDEVEVIARVNAQNSGTASYNWSIPATSVVINRPIRYTRELIYAPVLTGFSVQPTTIVGRYKVEEEAAFISFFCNAGTSNATTFGVPAPFTAKTITGMFWDSALGALTDNSAAAATGDVYIQTNTLAFVLRKASQGAWTASGTKSATFLQRYGI